MSGGVDSSVAALLLKNAGHDVAGVTMCLQDVMRQSSAASCSANRAVDDARRVCKHLGIRHFVFDFSQQLQKHVIDTFVAEYGRGRTPNPCVQCNKYIKFGLLFDKAVELGFDMLATGHYAATVAHQERTLLKRSKDIRKDQSYFLYAVNNAVLKHIVFPLPIIRKTRSGILPAMHNCRLLKNLIARTSVLFRTASTGNFSRGTCMTFNPAILST